MKIKSTVIILFICLLMLSVLSGCLLSVNEVRKDTDLDLAYGAKDFLKEYTDPQYLRQVIHLNAGPVFATGLSEGNVEIENEWINLYTQYVEYWRVDEGGKPTDLIYKSKYIKSGKTLSTDTLKVNLPKGTYKCKAIIYAVETETGNKQVIGESRIPITVYVIATADIGGTEND